MSLERLLQLAPAPRAWIDVPDPDGFAACEAELGLTLPTDFKELLTAYGTGRFLDYLFAPMRPLRQVYVYLDGGAGGFGQRAQTLRRLLGPTADRGENRGQGDHEIRFATAAGWRVTYRQWPSGRQIRIAFPAAEEHEARAAVLRAIPALGPTLRHAQTQRGERVWID